MSAPFRIEVRKSKYQAGEGEALLLPREWRPGAQATNKPGVIVVHGRGTLFDQMVTPPYAERILYALAAAGYPVMSIDAGGTATYGSDAAQAALGNAVTRLQGAAVGASAAGVHLLGFSVGSAVVLNYARAHAAQIKSLALVVPVVDIAYQHDTVGAPYAAEIEAAAGGAAAYAAWVAGHDPMQNIATHQAGADMRMWRSTNDATAQTARQDAFAAAVGAKVTVTSLGAVGHTPVTVDPAEVVAFVQAHG